MPVERRCALITGCSEGGIGFALAEEFLARGCRVYAAVRRLESARKLEAAGAVLLRLDVCDTASIDAAVAQVLAAEPNGPDILVNNAGATLRGAALDVPLDAVKRLYQLHVFGPLQLIQGFAPAMIRRGSGTIVNISSITALASTPFTSTYGSTKAALLNMTGSIRQELAPFGINVVVAAPGFVRTEIFDKSVAAGSIYAPEPSGPYAPVAGDIKDDFIESWGGAPVKPFARRFVSMALSRSPPRLYVTGSWSLVFRLLAMTPLILQDLVMWVVGGMWRYSALKWRRRRRDGAWWQPLEGQ